MRVVKLQGCLFLIFFFSLQICNANPSKVSDAEWIEITVPDGGQLEALVEAHGGSSIQKLRISGIRN